jgi:hypothetical protein
MAITAIKGIAPDWFEPEQTGENPTRFKLKPLNGLNYLELLAGLDGQKLTARSIDAALQYGLVAWENFKDFDGNEIEHSVRNFERIPPMTINAIVNEIMNISQLSGEERKN